MGKAKLLEVQWRVGDKPSLDTTVKIEPRRKHLDCCRGVNSSRREQWSMRPIKPRTDALSHPDNVLHDCTTGSPKGREPYGDGAPIVVGGVTTTHGSWESQLQGEGGQGLDLIEVRRYA